MKVSLHLYRRIKICINSINLKNIILKKNVYFLIAADLCEQNDKAGIAIVV